jgi:hypothetical protein
MLYYFRYLQKGVKMSVLSIYSLPEVLYSKLRTTTVSITEDNGVILLAPVAQKTNRKKLRGMFSDGRLSVDRHLEIMREDRELFEK